MFHFLRWILFSVPVIIRASSCSCLSQVLLRNYILWPPNVWHHLPQELNAPFQAHSKLTSAYFRQLITIYWQDTFSAYYTNTFMLTIVLTILTNHHDHHDCKYTSLHSNMIHTRHVYAHLLSLAHLFLQLIDQTSPASTHFLEYTATHIFRIRCYTHFSNTFSILLQTILHLSI